jgi:hypothetical protein
MRGVVWGSTIENAKEQLQLIVDRYFEEPGYVVNTQHSKRVGFKNGDVWVALRASEYNSHGRRFNIAYVDTTIEPDVFHSCILPCLTAAPYTAFNFYTPSSVKWPEHGNPIKDFFM